jgi:hypothetical protein
LGSRLNRLESVSAYRRIGVSAYRRIGVSAYRRIGVSAYRRIGVSAYRRIGVSEEFRRAAQKGKKSRILEAAIDLRLLEFLASLS